MYFQEKIACRHNAEILLPRTSHTVKCCPAPGCQWSCENTFFHWTRKWSYWMEALQAPPASKQDKTLYNQSQIQIYIYKYIENDMLNVEMITDGYADKLSYHIRSDFHLCPGVDEADSLLADWYQDNIWITLLWCLLWTRGQSEPSNLHAKHVCFSGNLITFTSKKAHPKVGHCEITFRNWTLTSSTLMPACLLYALMMCCRPKTKKDIPGLLSCTLISNKTVTLNRYSR